LILLSVDHFVIAAYAYIELIAFHQPCPEHRWWTALAEGTQLDPRLTHGARLSFG
jgi:hypothetical protein